MDASTLAAAALAIAIETSQTAAVQELLREREVLAMEKEDYRSFIWQRYYLPAQAGTASPLLTWRDAFRYQRDEVVRVRGIARRSVTTLRRAVNILEDELDSMQPVALEPEAIRAAGDVRAAVEPTARPAEEAETESEAGSEAAPVGAATSMLLRSTADVMRQATDTLAWEMLDEDAGGRERSRSPRR